MIEDYSYDIFLSNEPHLGTHDRIVFGADISPEDVSVFRNDNNELALVLNHGGGIVEMSNDQDRYSGWVEDENGNWHREYYSCIEEIHFADGTVWNTDDLNPLGTIWFGDANRMNDYWFERPEQDDVFYLDHGTMSGHIEHMEYYEDGIPQGRDSFWFGGDIGPEDIRLVQTADGGVTHVQYDYIPEVGSYRTDVSFDTGSIVEFHFEGVTWTADDIAAHTETVSADELSQQYVFSTNRWFKDTYDENAQVGNINRNEAYFSGQAETNDAYYLEHNLGHGSIYQYGYSQGEKDDHDVIVFGDGITSGDVQLVYTEGGYNAPGFDEFYPDARYDARNSDYHLCYDYSSETGEYQSIISFKMDTVDEIHFAGGETWMAEDFLDHALIV